MIFLFLFQEFIGETSEAKLPDEVKQLTFHPLVLYPIFFFSLSQQLPHHDNLIFSLSLHSLRCNTVHLLYTKLGQAGNSCFSQQMQVRTRDTVYPSSLWNSLFCLWNRWNQVCLWRAESYKAFHMWVSKPFYAVRPLKLFCIVNRDKGLWNT